MSTNIFIKENQSFSEVRSILKNVLNIDDFADVSSSIFQKVYNNKVGYFIFKNDENFFNIFILPKHLSPSKDKDSELKVIQYFIEYLKIHYKLKSKYKKYFNETSIKSALELTFESNHPFCNAQDIEQIIFYRYEYFLLHIKQFFNQHKSTQRELIPYSSQTIRYQFDLTKNIVELDKTKIHQKKDKDFIYSEIANIAYAAIKLFMNTKLDLMDENITNKNNLIKLSKQIQLLLRRRFNVSSSNRITLSKLISNQSRKYFKKKAKFLILYENILALFGIENILDENTKKNITRNLHSETFVLDPSLLYEWYVYDTLKDLSSTTRENFSVFFDKQEGTGKTYKLSGDKNRTNISSNPDFILQKDENIYIIDAKWKVIDDANIDLNDMLKLKRDVEVRNLGSNVYAGLIYCSIDKTRMIQEFLNNNINATFSFYAIKISFSQHSFSLKQFKQIAIK